MLVRSEEDKDSQKALAELPVYTKISHKTENKSEGSNNYMDDSVKADDDDDDDDASKSILHTSDPSKEGTGRKAKPLGCCRFPLGETVKCKWCVKNYHLKCLEPPLLYVPTNFVCERHLPEDMPPEPVTQKLPEAFSNYLLQSKVKIDWPLTDDIRISRKGLNLFEQEIMQEVDGSKAQCFNIRDVLLPSKQTTPSLTTTHSTITTAPPPLSSPLPPSSISSSSPSETNKEWEFDFKNIFLPEYVEEASQKDWSENAKLFHQFEDWISMLHTLREARYLKGIISTEKRRATHPAAGTPPAKMTLKRPLPLEVPRNPVVLETQLALLSAEDDLDSEYVRSTYSEDLLTVAKIRRALVSGDLSGIDAFPNLRAAIEAAPRVGETGAPCLAMHGRVVFVLDKDRVTIGRHKEGEDPPDIDLASLFGELCLKKVSHLHATITCKSRKTKKFVLRVDGHNGLFVNGLQRDQGSLVVLESGCQISIGLLTFEYIA